MDELEWTEDEDECIEGEGKGNEGEAKVEPEPEPEVEVEPEAEAEAEAEPDEVEASELYLSRSGRCCWDCFRWSCCIMTGESGSRRRRQGSATWSSHAFSFSTSRATGESVDWGLVGRDGGGEEKEGP